jgi:TRAP-type mannitol/chloroaromatic compound transport system substrate-binding protein
MKKRKNSIVLTLVLGLALLFTAGCEEKVVEKIVEKEVVVEKEQEKFKWKLAMTWPSHLAPVATPAKRFAEVVNEMSNGRLIVDVHGSQKHKAPMGVFDMVKLGQYEMGHSTSYFWKGKDINTLFFTTMPFGMTVHEQTAWFYYGGGLELMQRAYDKHGMYSFPGGNTGNQMGGWFKKEINSLEDLKGLKMRIPGFAGEVLADLGVAVTNIAPGELYTALERGTIDALEWVGPGMDIAMGFHKIAPFYYTGWHEPAGEMQFLINKKALEKLPKDLQAIVKYAMQAVSADVHAQNYHMSAVAWEKMLTEYPNIEIKNFPLPVLKAMKVANDRLIMELKDRNPLAKEIIESQAEYLKKSRRWTEISEQLFLESMKLVK